MRRAVVTGAFSNIGAAVAEELIRRGWKVETLTRRPAPAGRSDIDVHELRFDRDHLRRVLDGADLLVNTYWVRIPQHGATFDDAVERSRILIESASAAGVNRIAHVSVSNPSLTSPLGYYRGKAHVEQALVDSGVSHAIIRPTLVVGSRDVLTNNIAWFTRRFPLFALPSESAGRVQPVTMGDCATIICDAAERTDNVTVDAAGPDVLTFREYVTLLSDVAAGRRARFVTLPSSVLAAIFRLGEPLFGDLVLAREELDGLTQELLISHDPPLGTTSVIDWLRQHGAGFGRTLVNDQQLHAGAGVAAPIPDLIL